MERFNLFKEVGMHFLVTGHTGFKGAWLIVLLKSMGHRVSGLALNPEKNSLFNLSELSELLDFDYRHDIRNLASVRASVLNSNPDVIIHMAAQSQVLTSYEKPYETFDVNVNGTLNVLEVTRSTKNLKALLIVTTDKVYKNLGTLKKYKESDELGGNDPYSASKAMADILSQSWQNLISSPPIGIVRAGNVIGGGDYSNNRIIPNLIENISKGINPTLRNPDAIRPWQNVLDCLNGYIMAVNSLIENQKGNIWNFGPADEVCRNVSELTEFVIQQTNPNLAWEKGYSTLPKESKLLLIDSSKARSELKWREKYNFESSVKSTVNWYTKSDSISNLEFMKNEIIQFNLL